MQLTPWIACRGCVTHECALIWINFDFGAKVQWKFKIGKKSTEVYTHKGDQNLYDAHDHPLIPLWVKEWKVFCACQIVVMMLS